MEARGLTAEPTNRKRILLAVVALLILITVTFPLIAEATPTPTPTPAVPTATPAPVQTEITIQKEANQWWVVYPGGRKVTFESVAQYRIVDGDEETEGFFKFFIIDNNNNKLPVEFLEAKAYMQSKGFWVDANKDEDEKGFWDKVLGFLDDIWDGIVTIGKGVAFFVEALVTGQFLSLLVSACVSAAGDAFSAAAINIINMADVTEEVFQTSVASILVSFAKFFGFMLWVIGLVIAIGEIAINYKANRSIGESIHDFGMNFFKSFLAVTFFTTVPLPLYLLITDIATKICIPILNSGAANSFSLNNINFDFVQSDLMLLIFFIALLFTGIKVLFSFIKRGGVLMILILVGSVHMINTPRGYWDAFWSWCRQIIALCITQFCQIALFCCGISIFLSSFMVSFGTFLAGLSLILAAAEVPRIADRYGMDTSLKGNAMGAVQTVATIARMVITKSA